MLTPQYVILLAKLSHYCTVVDKTVDGCTGFKFLKSSRNWRWLRIFAVMSGWIWRA